jgi:beta-lactamase regulating signal transducer with metallopeptidase domain
MTTLLAGFVDAAIVLGLALAAMVPLRRRSAALRHAILTIAIVIAALMPAIEWLVPSLPIISWHDPVVAVASPVTLSSTSGWSPANDILAAADESVPWLTILVAAWLVGALVMTAALITSLVRIARFRRQCSLVTGRWRELADELLLHAPESQSVTLLQSRDSSLLVTCGVVRPHIILPADASAWTDARARIVLAHELAHVARRDVHVQLVAELLRVVQWMNPLVWLACRRLRQESEYACDDVVLTRGVEPTEYATHLLDVARQLSGRHRLWAAATPIAQPSTLEQRIVAMLHTSRHRGPLGRREWSITILAALALSIPLAAAAIAPAEQITTLPDAREAIPARTPQAPNLLATTPPASAAFVATPSSERLAARPEHAAAVVQSTGTVSGTVLDSSGAAVPGTELTLTDSGTGAQFTGRSDAAGQFGFTNLRPAKYELVARLPGFATTTNVVTVDAGGTVSRTITLPLGTLREQITIACGAPQEASAGVSTTHVSRVMQVRATLARTGSQAWRSVFGVVSAQPVRVGGNIRAPQKTKHVSPVCPPGAAAVGERKVRLTGRVGVDGLLTDLSSVALEPEAPAAFVEAALEAARQWTFTPTLLNGQPVEVSIAIDVDFTNR